MPARYATETLKVHPARINLNAAQKSAGRGTSRDHAGYPA